MPDVFYSPKLAMWYAESLKELSRTRYYIWKICGARPDTEYAIFPRRFWANPAAASHSKEFDYCFIGGYKTDPRTAASRAWVKNFAEANFTDNSYLQFTDRNTKRNYRTMGKFDWTLRRNGFVPKEVPVGQRNYFDRSYFTLMAKSLFVLCPAGDAPWSMRFYEALMCKAIPIVEKSEHTCRTTQEAALDYRFYLPNENHIYHEDWAEHNYRIFREHHTFYGR